MDSFYESDAWQGLRFRTLKKLGRKCMACFVVGVELHVDHIKPRSRYPELALDEDNLQILCRACNRGKSNKHEDDFRTAPKWERPQATKRRRQSFRKLLAEAKTEAERSFIAQRRLRDVLAKYSDSLCRKLQRAEKAGDSVLEAELLHKFLSLQRRVKGLSTFYDEV